MALASVRVTGSRALTGAAGQFSGYVGKGDSCPCLLAEGQETAKVLPPAQIAP